LRRRFETPSHPVNLRTAGRTDITILSENARLSAIRSCFDPGLPVGDREIID
jgi:hypothetical protein